MRNTIDWPQVKDIDALFSSVDTDGGGSLDIPELTQAMQALRDEAKLAEERYSTIRARMVFLQSRIDATLEAADATAEAEQADRQLEELRSNKSAAARMGAELLRKNIKIADLVQTWCDKATGEVDKRAFCRNAKKMGVDPPLEDDELIELFNSIDEDGGGTLDQEELKAALVNLREASQESDKEIIRLKKASVDLWRAAKAAQLERRRQKKADEAAAAAKTKQEAPP